MPRTHSLIRARHIASVAGAAASDTLAGEWFAAATTAHGGDALVPAYIAGRLFDEASGAGDAGALAYRVAPGHLARYGAMGREIACHGCLFEALQSGSVGLSEYSGLRFRLRFDGVFWLEIDASCPAVHETWQLYWLRPMLEIVRLVAGPSWWPRIVMIPGRRSAQIDALDFSGLAVVRQCSATLGIEVSERHLHAALPRFQMALLSDSPGCGRAAPTTFPESVRTLLSEHVLAGKLSLRSVARGFGLSVRSLQRALHRAGVSYAQLVQEARFNTAAALLVDRSRSITHIAYDVGYSDPAHFTRAFSRMAGMPPQAFRRLMVDPQRTLA